MDRREFLGSTCLAGLGVLVGGAMVNLANVKTLLAQPRKESVLGWREIPLRLEDTPDLGPIGGAYHLQIDELEKDILVVHVSPDKYVAVDIKCTHKGCDVQYEKGEKQFVCPCHQSTFDLHGSPVSGPAKRPLQAYEVVLSETEVTLRVPIAGEPEAPISDTTKATLGSGTTADSTRANH